MKKILVILTFLIGIILPANADVMPYYTNNISSNSIGVYQASNNIKVFKEPNENSQVLLNVSWDSKNYNSPTISASNLFVVFLPARDLAFLTVTDETEDWVEVLYNRNGNQKGWVKKDDEYRFLGWRTFFNLYGRKYGLYYMKDAPEDTKTIYGSNSDDAKPISKVIVPQVIKLTTVKGNWLLISAYDIDKLQKIGWIKWRSQAGEIYLFPAIK